MIKIKAFICKIIIRFYSIVAIAKENPALVEEIALFKLNYSRLYEVICTKIDQDETTLLLYMLVHSNSGFKSYIMARSDIEYLVS